MAMMKSPASPFYSPRTKTAMARPSTAAALSNIPILVTAFLAILTTGGPTYSFGVYALTLKHSLQLDQSQLETLGSASFAAGFVSWIPGLAVDAWGGRIAVVWGGLLQSVGLLLYWLVASQRTPIVPTGAAMLPTLSLLSVLIFTSNNWVLGGVFKGIVVSFGLGTKGKAVGAAKAYLGLGAGVFSSLFRALPHGVTGNDLNFLAMSSLCALAGIVLPGVLLLPNQEQMTKMGVQDESGVHHYYLIYAGLVALALVVVGSSCLDLFHWRSSITLPEWLHGVLILTVWMGPIVSLFLLPTHTVTHRQRLQKQQSALRRKVRQAMEERQQLPEQMRLLGPIPEDLDQPHSTNNTNSITIGWLSPENDDDLPLETPQPVPDLTLTETLQTLEAWLFLSVCTILVGSGTMLTINMGQLVQAQHRPPATAAACLGMFSAAQAGARVLSGAISESALEWHTWTVFGIRGVPRPAFLVACCGFAGAGHALLALYSSSLHWFVLGIVFEGIAFGGLWPLMVLIVGDLFGTVNHGANYMFADGFTCAVGTLSIAKFLTQFVYEQHVDGSGDIPTACYGDDCFRITHLVISGLCLISLICCTVLLYMTRTSYGSFL